MDNHRYSICCSMMHYSIGQIVSKKLSFWV